MFIEEFFEAEIVDFWQLLNANDGVLSYNEIGLSPNNLNFLNYLKMVSAIPEDWLDENPNLTSIIYVFLRKKFGNLEKPIK